MKAKKIKLNNLSQTHAKEETTQPTTLDQIWGDTGMSKYKTLIESEYVNELNDMMKVDIQSHASKLGLIPIDNTDLLKRRLVAEFRKHISQFNKPSTAVQNENISKEARKILSEGK